jgi:thiamine transport system permease protein
MRFGFLALAVVLLLVGGALAALLVAATGLPVAGLLADPYLRHVIGFTLWQASLSTALSVGLAVPIARAFARQSRFPGRAWLLRLFLLPMVTPVIVAVFGIVAVYGTAGWANRILGALGFAPRSYLYGLPGILIAHVFFNLPLAVRLLLGAWEAVPGETWRLAAQLGMRSGVIFRVIEWPMLRERLPGAGLIVFLLCFMSFAAVLALGGGPAATTLEVAIYQALRFDFDLDRAVALALLQVLFCVALMLFAHRLAVTLPAAGGQGRPIERDDRDRLSARLGDGAWILLACAVLLLPLAAILVDGATGPVLAAATDSALGLALLRSLGVGLGAGSLATVLALGLGQLMRGGRRLPGLAWATGAVELAGMATVAISPLVLGTGFFLLLRGAGGTAATALVAIATVNGLMALPYVLRILSPIMLSAADRHDRLCAALDIAGWNRWRIVDWPVLRRAIGTALGFAAAFAAGDLGAAALFGSPDATTLPLLLLQQLGAYRIDAAAVTALLLLATSFGLFALFERVLGGHAAA